MKIFGLTISRTKASQPMPVIPNRGGWIRVFESFTGAWQQNVTVDKNSVLVYSTVYACMTLIASDISKLCVDLIEEDEDDIWHTTDNPAYSPVLRKPNRYQNRIQFWESWVLSKLSNGNTYVLKERDSRGVVKALYVLDPCRVKPLVTDDGTVYYQLSRDNMAGLTNDPIVPASEIIHDRFNCLFHPLIGTSPIVACGVTAMQGIAIQNSSTTFFNNKAMPSGFLTAPGAISDETAGRLKANWETNYSGDNAGKVAVLGDGLKFESMVMNSTDAQLIEQLKWTAEIICSVFHIPPYKVGIGAIPSGASVQSLNLEYYSQALQRLIEDAELCLDEGLALALNLGVQFDIDNLLRMDTLSMVTSERDAVGAGIKTPNEARKRLNLSPVTGGESPYLQQQNFSLEALAKRDALPDPFNTAKQTVIGLNPNDNVKSLFDAYGVGVRAGAITPQLDDEKNFRKVAGFPDLSDDVDEVWGKEPVRRPITLSAPPGSNGSTAPIVDPNAQDPNAQDQTDKRFSDIEKALQAIRDSHSVAPALPPPEKAFDPDKLVKAFESALAA